MTGHSGGNEVLLWASGRLWGTITGDPLPKIFVDGCFTAGQESGLGTAYQLEGKCQWWGLRGMGGQQERSSRRGSSSEAFLSLSVSV